MVDNGNSDQSLLSPRRNMHRILVDEFTEVCQGNLLAELLK